MPPPPQKIWNLKAMRLLLRPFLGKTTEFYVHEYLPFLHVVLYSTGFDFPIICWSHKPHPSQMRLMRLIVHLEERKAVGRLGRDLSHCLQPSCIMFQHVTMLCACHGHFSSIGPIWRHQASHGWGKKWSGCNWTNRTGGYGPALGTKLYNHSSQ